MTPTNWLLLRRDLLPPDGGSLRRRRVPGCERRRVLPCSPSGVKHWLSSTARDAVRPFRLRTPLRSVATGSSISTVKEHGISAWRSVLCSSDTAMITRSRSASHAERVSARNTSTLIFSAIGRICVRVVVQTSPQACALICTPAQSSLTQYDSGRRQYAMQHRYSSRRAAGYVIKRTC